jgi:hypothetical protein
VGQFDSRVIDNEIELLPLHLVMQLDRFIIKLNVIVSLEMRGLSLMSTLISLSSEMLHLGIVDLQFYDLDQICALDIEDGFAILIFLSFLERIGRGISFTL